MTLAIEVGRRGDACSSLERADPRGRVEYLVWAEAWRVIVQKEVGDADAFNLRTHRHNQQEPVLVR